ncbi:MAG: BrxA/BrxB family bacilliredoxin [Bacteroidia bacterium]|nr:BrxA/BrxB family bacilliredoxin [Bacteroidia bacterium]
MYPEELVRPMKNELISSGFVELLTPEVVNEEFKKSGTLLMVINSVCGCAAGACRPGVKLSLQHPKKPDRLATSFAGFDIEAVAEARKHFLPYPPSSPSIALLKDGKLVFFMERHQIEGRTAQQIADILKTAYDEYC